MLLAAVHIAVGRSDVADAFESGAAAAGVVGPAPVASELGPAAAAAAPVDSKT